VTETETTTVPRSKDEGPLRILPGRRSRRRLPHRMTVGLGLDADGFRELYRLMP
jgi:hypothetical protein